MKVGFGQADITPFRPMPLCGFASRCDAPLQGVDDPIGARALVIDRAGVIAYDLLALGLRAHDMIMAGLSAAGLCSSINWILCATHTHSAPAAITLRGCGDIQDDYLDFLVEKSVEAAGAAAGGKRPAVMRHAAADLPGHSYNRRRILDDGRVSMALKPDGEIIHEGPVLSRMNLVRFEDEMGRGIAGLATWPCHPDTVCGMNVSADFPGELIRRLSAIENIPFVFLQGAAADINPFFSDMTRAEMLANVDGLMADLGPIRWTAPASRPSIVLADCRVPLQFNMKHSAADLRDICEGMGRIAESGSGPSGMLRILGDILNIKPGALPEKRMAMHIAGILRDWSCEMIGRAESGVLPVCELRASKLDLGELILAFVAAEPFVETALKLRAASPGAEAVLIGYAAPLIGYLPPDQALEEGGYEADYAYRFYDQPGPFRAGSEPKVVDALKTLIASAL